MVNKLPLNLAEQINPVIDLIKSELKNVPEIFNTAYSHQELSEPDNPTESSVTGDTIYVDGQEIRHNFYLLIKAYKKFFITAKTSGLSISMIEMKFERQKDGTWAHDMAFETLENKKNLLKLRAKYDENMKKLIIDGANNITKTWRSTEFCREMKNEDAFNVFLPGKEIQKMKPTEEMASIMKDVGKLYSSFGRTLRNITWSVDADDLDYIDVFVWNG